MAKLSRETKQKHIIDEEIKGFKAFFDSTDLYEKVKKKDSKIGIATIYRFLKEKEKKNQLYSYMCERKKIYSLNKKSHCHFICEKTGKTIHFELENLDFLRHIKNKIPGTINSASIEVRGVCDSCIKK
jgi:Fur family ferric uptake transcriptional regulator